MVVVCLAVGEGVNIIDNEQDQEWIIYLNLRNNLVSAVLQEGIVFY